MADILSQEEIDRLLNAASTEPSAGPGGGGGRTLDDDDVSRVMRVAGQIFAAANTTVGTLIARPAGVTHREGETASVAEFDNKSHVLVHAPFRSGFSGELRFLMETAAATQLADLILGGDGVAKEVPADADFDALKEAFGQILGNSAPSISASVSIETGFAAPSVEHKKPGELAQAFGDPAIFSAKGQLEVKGVLNAPLWIVCDIGTAEGISSALAAAEPAAPSRAEPPRHAAAPAYAAPAAYAAAPAEVRNIDLILDIEVEVMVRLGNAEMPLREIQKLRPGSIIDLDRDTEALVELVVNDKVIAKGELVVVSSDHFALRVTEILTPTERIRSLGGQ